MKEIDKSDNESWWTVTAESSTARAEIPIFAQDETDAVIKAGVILYNLVLGTDEKYVVSAKGARREEDKLFLNNLYGKLSTNRDSSFKIPYLHESGKVCYTTHFEQNKKTFYIPAGAAVTAYARCFTIRAAQANYDRFCYSDTDSIHLIGQEPAKAVSVK